MLRFITKLSRAVEALRWADLLADRCSQTATPDGVAQTLHRYREARAALKEIENG